ncbi:MAG: carboxypeptidase-like regulatory domain-containing protein, partial [Alcanivoracaceae bacterium]
LDGEGHRGQVVYYDSQGPDGVWFTADDRVKTYNLATFNAAGVSLSSVTYNARGGDNTWFTSDDQIQLHTLTILDAGFKPAYTATYNNRGTDSAWFTADDVIQSWTYYGYDGNGNPVLVATHTNKGGDGTWFTADDSATGIVSLKDADGNVLVNSQVSGSGAMGPDGKWLTGDENFSFFFYAEYDENGYQTRSAQFNGAGADGLWFTADDTPNQFNYWERTYDSEGNLQQQITYNPAHAPADPAFSDSHIDQYRAYQPGTSSYVTVSRANFGGDGVPFTSDDTIPWPYAVQVANGYDQYNQPGPDGIWYTADDVRSGYVRWQYSGNRKTREDRYNAADELIGYSEATPITASEYRWDNYTSDGVGGFTLTDYAIIEEDGNGYALWTTWYTAADAVSYVEYTERDAGGNILRQGWGYSPGADLAWGTFDDFGYFSVSEYDGSDLVSSGTERPGDDGLWGTEDDTYSLDAIYQMLNDPDTLALNSGEEAPGCADLLTGIGASGDINVHVVDQNGAPLSGVIAQLNQAGSTVTTAGNGDASFAGLSGTQDVHFFKDGYTWESFYCVAPGVDVTLQAKLSSMSEAQAKSIVAFYVSPTSERITLRLLDGNGKMINTRPQYSVFGELGSTTYAYLDFDLPAGTEVSGTLWAFKVDGSNGRLLDAQDLGPQTYTTIATYPLPGPAGEPLTVSFNASEPARLKVASRSVLSYPPGLMNTPLIKVELDELFPLPNNYESSFGGSYVTAPDTTLPTLAQPSALSAGTEQWQAWYPGDYPDIGAGIFKPEIHTGFQYGPYIEAQDGSGSNPTISWIGARQLGSGDFQTVTTLELRSAAAGMGYMSHWTLHVPAGDEQVTLPSLPAGITDPYLPESRYPMIITTRAVPELGYHALVGEENLHDLRRDLATETLRYGTDFTEGADLQR